MWIHEIDNNRKKRGFLTTLPLTASMAAVTVLLTTCGKQEIDFGEDRFYGIRETQPGEA